MRRTYYRRSCGNGGNSWSYSWSSGCGGTPTMTYSGNVPQHILQQLQGGQQSSGDSKPSKGSDEAASQKAGATKDYYEYGLELHNWYRKRHGSPKLVLSDRLNKAADAYAYKLACQRQLVHNSGLDYGENLYMSIGGSGSKKDHVRDACKAWYNEVKHYNFSYGGFSMATGHFTAMVWKSSTQLGIGVAQVGNYVVVVGNYKVFPNMQGQFQNNVLPYREMEDTESEEEDSDSDDSDSEDGTMMKVPKEEKKEKDVPNEEKKDNDVPNEEKEISKEAIAIFKTKCDDKGSIGWQELRDLLNSNVQVGFEFEIDKAICSLLISMITLRTGEKTRINLAEFGKALKSFEGFLNAYTEFDSDCSGLLDPFEFKSAMQEAGFDISWRTFKSLQKIFSSEDGNLNFRNYVCCFLLLSKLQIVQEKRSANPKKGSFEDFSLRDWIEDELAAASKE